ncbi:DUF4214 domain-containing protein [Cellulomonas sp.]|uniref:RCC1 domain-containing protein n=1 Tax=Cellulomonas sp. TaxID=40001 RepID=UPI003BAAC1D2
MTFGLVAPAAPAAAWSSGLDPVQVDRYVASVYDDLFGRRPDPSGAMTWRTALLNGQPRVAVANSITSSYEYRARLVTGAYERFLGRGPDAEGLRFWVSNLSTGWTVARIEAGFLQSDEYYRLAGSNPAGWVRTLYRDVLHRDAAPSEVDSWVQVQARGAERMQVAMGFLLSTEHLATVVDGYYLDLLGRHLDPSGHDTWISALQRGAHDEEIIGGIIASAEYWATAIQTVLPNYLEVTPWLANIRAGGAVTFTVIGRDSTGQPVDVTAQSTFTVVVPGTGSCIGATCTMTAVGQPEVRATWRGGLVGLTKVQVDPGPLASVTLTPSATTVADGASVVLSAAGADAYGNPLGDVTPAVYFSVDGDVSACAGARCRPVGPGRHTVTAWTNEAAPKTVGRADVQVGVAGAAKFRAFEWGPPSTDSPPVAGTQVGLSAAWASVSAGDGHTLAIRTDGTLWSWGGNAWGELGTGNWGDPVRAVPEPVGNRTDWVSVSAGRSSHAIARDGSLWSWGEGNALGSASSPVSTATPERVGTGTDWASVSGGSSFALAIKRDGSLWSWGDNTSGQLGDPSVEWRKTPARVGTGTWSSVAAGDSHVVAIATDGTLWTWGTVTAAGNTYTLYPTPTKIGVANDWRAVAAGVDVSAGIRSDGSLWTWGWGHTGQLGDGTLETRTDPVQVGRGTSWAAVDFGYFHTAALDTTGGLWRWGLPEQEQPESSVFVVTPQRVGTQGGWASMTAGYRHTVALRP